MDDSIPLTVHTSDGFPLAVTRFGQASPARGAVLISAATGVRQTFYFNFARFLASRGYSVYTYDYRGIGGSRTTSVRSTQASYLTWGTLDYPALVDHLRQAHANQPLYLVGHSFGGNGIGMSPASQSFQRIVTVAASITYWRYFPLQHRWKALFNGYFAVPLITRMCGFFPSRIKGLGESLPYGVAMQWMRGLTTPESIVGIARPDADHYASLRNPILMISLEDDWIASHRGVDALAGFLPNARVTRRQVSLAEAGNQPVGHVNFFRQRFAGTLWPLISDWLQQDSP